MSKPLGDEIRTVREQANILAEEARILEEHTSEGAKEAGARARKARERLERLLKREKRLERLLEKEQRLERLLERERLIVAKQKGGG